MVKQSTLLQMLTKLVVSGMLTDMLALSELGSLKVNGFRFKCKTIKFEGRPIPT